MTEYDNNHSKTEVSIQYLHHSGFLIDTGIRKLVFDWDGTSPAPEIGDSPCCIFVSTGMGIISAGRFFPCGRNLLRLFCFFPMISAREKALFP